MLHATGDTSPRLLAAHLSMDVDVDMTPDMLASPHTGVGGPRSPGFGDTGGVTTDTGDVSRRQSHQEGVEAAKAIAAVINALPYVSVACDRHLWTTLL